MEIHFRKMAKGGKSKIQMIKNTWKNLNLWIVKEVDIKTVIRNDFYLWEIWYLIDYKTTSWEIYEMKTFIEVW